ncbi:hypothetical protein [Anaerosinus massiliensis]|uniref:hypothetical protein n=1 Tax=Massilibacillus massiliensis TaxID=1806837 RepID=UPI000DA61F0D|nr:hypothetical protein [Massilibacillus massiliensis]
MKMYLLEPEVPGGIGKNSILEHENGRIKKAVHLHYEFDGWLGDDLITTSPFFIITERLADKIQTNDIIGYDFEDLETSLSDNFKELYPIRVLPKFRMLIPLGIVETDKQYIIKWTGHDLCLRNGADFIVSEKALVIFQKYNLNYCDISELETR